MSAINSAWYSLLTEPWWTRDPSTATGWDIVYRWFNLGEAAVWMLLAVFVVNRWCRNRNSRLELAYALAFAAFGVTDICESSRISAALVLVKGANLAALLWLRALVIRRWYPQSRLA